MKALPFLLSVPLLLAACGSEAPAPDPSSSTVPEASDAVPARPVAVRADAPTVTLSSTGLAIGKGGEATTLEFGTAQAEAIAAMRKARGMPEITRNEECGAGVMDFAKFGPLTLNFMGGKLAGWRTEGDAGIVTADGMRTGLTLDDVRTERSVEELDSTLGGEFQYAAADGGAIGGFVGAGGKITSLHAGTNCFFR